jgi:hypothetical protein
MVSEKAPRTIIRIIDIATTNNIGTRTAAMGPKPDTKKGEDCSVLLFALISFSRRPKFNGDEDVVEGVNEYRYSLGIGTRRMGLGTWDSDAARDSGLPPYSSRFTGRLQ